MGQVVELNKRFIEGYLHYQHEPRIIELRTKIIAYNRLLRDMGLADHQVERATNRSVKSGVLLIYRTGLLLWWSALALPGFLTHAPIFVAAKIISRRKQKGEWGRSRDCRAYERPQLRSLRQRSRLKLAM